jgi:hypothetical protein
MYASVLALALAPAAFADPNVLPVAGAGTNFADGIAATDALFGDYSPVGVAVPHDYGYFYREYVIVDNGRCKIRRVTFPYDSTSDVGEISTVVGPTSGTGCGFPDGGFADRPGTDYRLGYPTGVSATADNYVLIAESAAGGRIHRWSNSDGYILTLAGPTTYHDPECTTPIADGATALGAIFCNVSRVAANPTNPDRFLIVDSGARNDAGTVTFPGRVYEYYVDTNVAPQERLRTVAGGCSQAMNAPAALAECFTNPLGVTWMPDGDDFLVTDTARNQIFRFQASDNTVDDVIAGTGDPTSNDGSNFGDGGLATAATFAEPSDVAVGLDGGIYVADTYNCALRKISDLDPATAEIFHIAGQCGDTASPDRVPKNAYQSNLWPFGLAFAPAGLYIADPETKQVQLLERTTITSKPARYTSATSAEFEFESIEYEGTFSCKLDSGTWQTCATPFPLAGPLNEGDHTLAVCAAGTSPDPVGGECYARNDEPRPDPTPAVWTWTVDTSDPTGLALTEPADGATGLPPTPTFKWQAANGGASGIDHYELIVDGAKAADVSCSAATCERVAPAALGEGTHLWKIRALDRAGNASTSEERTLASGSPPTAAFTIAPNPVLIGRSVTFDASASSDTSGPIQKFEWDLDGDGTFEKDMGRESSASAVYAAPGIVNVKLRVTDGIGLQTVSEQTLTVTAPSLPNTIGVTINKGAQYTNTPSVKLTAAAPFGTTNLLVSNDGGFLAAKTFKPATTIDWVLDSSGPERLPKTVYLRFLFGTFSTPNYTDDIILDERPPVVSHAAVAGAGSASAVRIAKAKKWKLRVKARDSNSGVAGVQVTTSKRKPGKLLKYRRKLTVKSAKRPKYLRARDRAGNYSKWKKLR